MPLQAGRGDLWWRSAVFYQIYPRSFRDRNGDGTGDLRGVIEGLDYLSWLGIDALWISPFFTSPQVDHGYDVSDYCDVDPLFGNLADFDELLNVAHCLGIRVTIDVVPNHSSNMHPWFQAALADPDGSSRERYIFREGRGANGELPPSNHVSAFGGPAWTRVAGERQWYYHLHASEQPDLNWESPLLQADFAEVLRFWLDRGVDGFRVDVADHLIKGDPTADTESGKPALRKDPGSPVHSIFQTWHDLLAQYEGDRVTVAEVFGTVEEVSAFVAPDELDLYFNFPFMHAGWDAERLRATVESALGVVAATGSPATWVTDSHDEPRSVTRLGGGDVKIGLARARAMALVLFALPGVPFVYQGQELGLPNHDLISEDELRDPVWERSGRTRRGRDGSRVPLPWEGSSPPYGFPLGGAQPWLPQPEGWADLTMAHQVADPNSTLALFRSLISMRRDLECLHGSFFEWLDAPQGCLRMRRQAADGSSLDLLVNMSSEPVSLPPGKLVASSGPVEGFVEPDSAVWFLN